MMLYYSEAECSWPPVYQVTYDLMDDTNLKMFSPFTKGWCPATIVHMFTLRRHAGSPAHLCGVIVTIN
jgi:hypothetical protein